MDLFSQPSGQVSPSVKYQYPNAPEYPIRELLLMEKESSGMYFSGHLIDGYSRHLEVVKPDKISEIIDQLSDEAAEGGKYKDKSLVKIAGVITSKRTKVTRNGDVMAYLTVEDRYAEIDVVVFAKSYQKYSDILNDDFAVVIQGNIATEEGEMPRILLSSASPLISDSEYSSANKNAEPTIYIKVPNLSDPRINNLKRISALNRGNAKIVLYDESRKKYCAMKDALVDPSDKVLDKLSSLFNADNVILK
jgi:DNA polymerase-3 subunit alpha